MTRRSARILPPRAASIAGSLSLAAWFALAAGCASNRQLAVERAETPPVVAQAPETPVATPSEPDLAAPSADDFAQRTEKLLAEAQREVRAAAPVVVAPIAVAPIEVAPAAVAPAAAAPRKKNAEETRAAPPVIVPPQVISSIEPSYPELSRRLGEQGAVVVRIDLSDAGRVEGTSVVTSSGFARLDEAARSAIAQWRFQPATRNDRPVPWSFDHRVTFELKDSR